MLCPEAKFEMSGALHDSLSKHLCKAQRLAPVSIPRTPPALAPAVCRPSAAACCLNCMHGRPCAHRSGL